MRFFTIFRSFFCGAALLFLCGCMSFEYTGRTFAPLKAGQLPRFFSSQQQLPAGKYIIIGRAVIKTGIRTEIEDVQEKLLEEAALRGADAVCISSEKIVYRGIYESGEDTMPSNESTDPFNLTPDGAPIQENLAGEAVSLPAESRGAPELVVKALFLKDKAAVEKIVSGRRKKLDAIIGDPEKAVRK